MSDPIAATRTKVYLPKLRARQDEKQAQFWHLQEQADDSWRDMATQFALGRAEPKQLPEIAHRCNVHRTLMEALELIECVYRKNCVAEGEPSSVLDALQRAIRIGEGRVVAGPAEIPQGDQK